MAKNYIQPGDVLELTAPYQRNAGQGALIGALFCIAMVDVANGARCSWATCDVWTLEKNSAEAWTEGQKIYWDNTNKRCTSTASGNTLIGVATAVAANPSSTGIVRLNEAVA